jgi:hypothetical protein
MNPPTYQLELQPLPDKSDPQGIRRLRLLLKELLRCHRMRVVSILPRSTWNQREAVNLDLLGSAFEQRDDESPPRLPRLSKPPQPRPLFDEPKWS